MYIILNFFVKKKICLINKVYSLAVGDTVLVEEGDIVLIVEGILVIGEDNLVIGVDTIEDIPVIGEDITALEVVSKVIKEDNILIMVAFSSDKAKQEVTVKEDRHCKVVSKAVKA